METNADPLLIRDFFDYWNSAQLWLKTTTSLGYRLGLMYNIFPDSVIAGYIARDPDSAATGLASVVTDMTTVTVRDLIDSIRHSTTGIVTYYDTHPVPYVTAGVADTIELAEHHIYGSSRIGVQHFESDSNFRNVYNYFDTSQSLSPMNRGNVWFSAGYGEGINKGNTEPWGMEIQA